MNCGPSGPQFCGKILMGQNFELSHRLTAIPLIPVLMILFGVAEAVTALTHHSFGVPIADEDMASYAGAAIGILYAAAGLLVLTMNRIAVAGAIVLMLLVIAGRIVMLLTGLYPIDTTRQIAALSGGTAIAAGFIVYIGLRWHRFK
jgi:uncharacterized membrane protein